MTDLLIIFAAKYLIYISALALATYFLSLSHRQKHRLFCLALVGLPLAYALARLAGHLWYNPRPFVVEQVLPLVAHVPDNGFPSDHMLFASALAMLALYVNRPLGICLWVIAGAVGAARVFAGVHHGVDVAVSAGIAVVAVYAAHQFLYYMRRER